MTMTYVYVRLKRPEGYEDVHPELVLADANINPAFEPELVSPCRPGSTCKLGGCKAGECRLTDGVPPSLPSSVVFPASLVGEDAAGAYYRADDVRRLLTDGVTLPPGAQPSEGSDAG